MKKKKKSLDIFGVEKQRVYRINVTLSRSLKFFLEELYNDPYWFNVPLKEYL